MRNFQTKELILFVHKKPLPALFMHKAEDQF